MRSVPTGGKLASCNVGWLLHRRLKQTGWDRRADHIQMLSSRDVDNACFDLFQAYLVKLKICTETCQTHLRCAACMWPSPSNDLSKPSPSISSLTFVLLFVKILNKSRCRGRCCCCFGRAVGSCPSHLQVGHRHRRPPRRQSPHWARSLRVRALGPVCARRGV